MRGQTPEEHQCLKQVHLTVQAGHTDANSGGHVVADRIETV